MYHYDKSMDANVLPPMSSRKTAHRSRPRRSKENRDFPSTSTRELVRLLIYEEREAQDLQKVLLNLSEQLNVEKRRADEAEQCAKETATRFKSLNDARLSAQQEAAKVSEELRLYKAQLETAQKEIFRAQDVLKEVDAQRHSAELDAAKSRTMARKLQHERAVELAKEEGRRMGFQEGIERGKLLAFQWIQYAPSMEGQYLKEDEYGPGILAPDEYYANTTDGAPATENAPARESDTTGTLVTSTPAPVATPPQTGISVIPTPGPVASPPRAVEANVQPPIIVHNVAPPSHYVHVKMPPDGFIPETGNDSIIRLPPPHELARPPTLYRSPSPPLPAIPQDEEPALMVPEPMPSRRSSTATPGAANPQYSPESNSTTISQLEIVSVPTEYVPKNVRGSPLSVIPEVLSTATSPYRQSQNGSWSKLPESAMPTPRASAAELEDHSRRQSRYLLPREPPGSSGSSRVSLNASLSGGHVVERRESRSTMSSVPGITIQPPSRPQSNMSGNTPGNSGSTALMGEFLSPADADRPMSLPAVSPTTLSQVPLSSSNGVPILPPNDELPPGFVPSFTPGPLTGSTSMQTLPSGSPMPRDFAASTYVKEPGGCNGHRAPQSRLDDVVIPIPSAAMYGPVDSDDEVSSSLSSLDAPMTSRVKKSRAGRKHISSGLSGVGYMYAPAVPLSAGRTPSGTSKVSMSTQS